MAFKKWKFPIIGLSAFALFCLHSLFSGCTYDEDDDHVRTEMAVRVYNSGTEDVYLKIASGPEALSAAEVDAPTAEDFIELDVASNFTVEIPSDSLHFYSFLFFKKSTLQNHSWDEIQQQDLHDSRYEFTVHQLDSLHGEVVYVGP